MYEDIITVSTVTLRPMWGQKEQNLNRILGYMKAAKKKGSDLVVFPEMALTAYDDEPDKPVAEKMQHKLAETVPGPSTAKVEALAKELGLYVVMGMPIQDPEKPDTVYNGLAIFTPEGLAGDYHKMHLPAPEPNWATRGDKPFILDTPWGPIGCAICYDTYCFPELMDYYVAKGCRLYINSTALAHCHGKCLGDDTLRAQVIREGIFIVSSNLGGLDKDNYFWGGSSIMGPRPRPGSRTITPACPSPRKAQMRRPCTRPRSTWRWPRASSTSTTRRSTAPTGARTSTSRCSRTSWRTRITASSQ